MRSGNVQYWWRWLRWPLAVAVLAWLIVPNMEGLKELVQVGVTWQWLVAAIFLRFLSLAITGYRWNLLLIDQDIRLQRSRVARMVGIGYVCNFVLPGTIGGDVAKAGLIAAESPSRRKRAFATVPIDRALGLLAFVILGSIAGLLCWPTIPSQLLHSAVALMVGISVVGIAGLAVATRTRLAEQATRISDQPPSTTLQKLRQTLAQSAALLQRSKATVWFAIVLGLVAHVCLCSSAYCCLLAFAGADAPIEWLDQLWLTPSAEVPAAFLSLPGGLGAREGALAYFFGEFGTNPTEHDRYRDIGVLAGGCFSLISILLAIGVSGVLAATSRTWSDESDALPST